ncbi:hypothetical protein XENOCAPTIV_026177 [Xenoophorus captivus]|uniref:Uncharacterized protein n=1 Tax=Xenoophorus captivus TaxID=1517983 RepID=A0ABV0RDY0_9TELE
MKIKSKLSFIQSLSCQVTSQYHHHTDKLPLQRLEGSRKKCFKTVKEGSEKVRGHRALKGKRRLEAAAKQQLAKEKTNWERNHSRMSKYERTGNVSPLGSIQQQTGGFVKRNSEL